MSLVLIGEGEALVKGERVSGRRGAASAAGIAPVALGPKEGLALLNGTQVSTALALFGLVAAERNAEAAILAGAMSVDAVMGSDTPFDPRIHALRPHPGQQLAASHYRRLLAGSQIRASHLEGDDRVQDPYSFRCQPQVMGACLDLLANAARTLVIEANAVSDNPLVFAEDGAVLSGGNFHAEPVAFAADMIAMAVAEMGSLSERRIAALIDSIDLAAAALPHPQPRPQLRLHDPAMHGGGADEREQADVASGLGQFRAHLGQPGGPCVDGHPRGAAAGADERQPGAHHRHRADGGGRGHRLPPPARLLEPIEAAHAHRARQIRQARRGPRIRHRHRGHRHARRAGQLCACADLLRLVPPGPSSRQRSRLPLSGMRRKGLDMKLFDLTGRVAVITGTSRGIGRELAHGFAEAGATVVGCARSYERRGEDRRGTARQGA